MRLIMQLVGRGRQVRGGAFHLGSRGETRTLHGPELAYNRDLGWKVGHRLELRRRGEVISEKSEAVAKQTQHPDLEYEFSNSPLHLHTCFRFRRSHD
jgi:hypothetical protein